MGIVNFISISKQIINIIKKNIFFYRKKVFTSFKNCLRFEKENWCFWCRTRILKQVNPRCKSVKSLKCCRDDTQWRRNIL